MNLIVEIIPKITSPLSVICFLAYIFYLYRKRQDEKNEKSLLVKDDKAAGIAAKQIIKDHPDIELKSINGNQAVEIAKEIVSNSLVKHKRNLNAALILCIIFALTFLLSLLISTKDESIVIYKNNDTWAKKTSIKNKYPYATLAVVQHIKLRKQINSDTIVNMIAEFRNHYTLSANWDLKSTDQVFEEQYTSLIGEIEHWSGNFNQSMKSNIPSNYYVDFNAMRNDVFSVLTGADITYKLPFEKAEKPYCFDKLRINNQSEWFTCYPNSIDYIDEIVIIVESSDFELSLPSNAAYKKENKEGAETTTEGSCKSYLNDEKCTLVATWKNLKPAECVGFKIKWKEKK